MSSAAADDPELDERAGDALRTGGLELDGHAVLAARQACGNLVLAIELFGRMVFEVLGRDLLAVDEDVERAASSLAAAVRAHERDRPIRVDLQLIAEPTARLARPLALEKAVRRGLGREPVLLLAVGAVDDDAIDRRAVEGGAARPGGCDLRRLLLPGGGRIDVPVHRVPLADDAIERQQR